MTAALRVTDGAFVVVDCVSGEGERECVCMGEIVWFFSNVHVVFLLCYQVSRGQPHPPVPVPIYSYVLSTALSYCLMMTYLWSP